MWCDLLWTLPPTTQTTHVNCTCVPCFTHPGGGKARVCVCVPNNLHTNYFRGLLQRALVNQSADSLNRFAHVPAPLRSTRPTCPTRTLARSLCKQELKLLVCNTHPQAFAMWRKINVKCCAFSSQMQTNDLLPCGAHVWGYAPIKLSPFHNQITTIYPHMTHICPIYAFYTSIFMLSTCSFTCYKE